MIRKLTDELRQQIFSAHDFRTRAADKYLSNTFDVCVIGSGPGGAVAAATLAQAGLKVILVERGPFIPAEQFNFRTLDMTNRTGHVELTSGYRTILYQGNLLGGGSIVYGGVAMKPPQFVFDEWKALSGVSTLDLDSLSPHYQHIAETMSVTKQTKELENRPNAIVREMATVLGRPAGLEIVERYTQGCAGAGLCNFGCGFDLKGNMINSFLPIGLATGNIIVFTNCEAVSLEGKGERDHFCVTGLNVIIREPAQGNIVARGVIKAKSYIVACGAFFSSALLLRSQAIPVRDRIGAKVYLQPHAQIFALFDEPITQPGTMDNGQYIPYNGVPAIYNFTGFLKEHNFFWLASILFPANLASFISYLPPEEHFQIMRRFHHTMSITLTIRDNPDKSRVVVKDGKARLDYKESRADIESMRNCFLLAARGFLDVGARRVFLPMLRPPKIETKADLKIIEKMKFEYEDLLLYSDHTNSGNPYGIDSHHGVTDQRGKLFGTDNLYLADASLFPSACGLNPSWTIMALARHVAINLANK
ncbi:MAG: GMC family oxidoreductase [Acidobacteriota bacterium]